MNKAQKQKAIVDFLEKATRAAAAKSPMPWCYDPATRPSEKAQKLADVIYDNDFGCQSSAVIALVEAIIGEPLPDMELADSMLHKFLEKTSVPAFTCITSHPNSKSETPAIILAAIGNKNYVWVNDLDNGQLEVTQDELGSNSMPYYSTRVEIAKMLKDSRYYKFLVQQLEGILDLK